MNFDAALELCRNLVPLQIWLDKTKNPPPHHIEHASVWIDLRAKVSAGAVLLRNTEIRGGKSVIEGGVVIEHSIIDDSRLEERVEVGPYNIIRRCEIGAGTKIPYQSELADVIMGQDNNVARNCTFSNSNGLWKEITYIGSGCLIGTCVNINGGTIIGNEVRVSPNLFIAWPDPIKDHSWLVPCNHPEDLHLFDELENCSFKIPGHWAWIRTRISIPDPAAMRAVLTQLGAAFDDTKKLVAFLRKERGALKSASLLDILKSRRLSLSPEERLSLFQETVQRFTA